MFQVFILTVGKALVLLHTYIAVGRSETFYFLLISGSLACCIGRVIKASIYPTICGFIGHQVQELKAAFRAEYIGNKY